MSKWLSTHVTTLAFSALTLIIALFVPILSHATQVTLSWDANDPAPDGYLVYHRTEGQAYDYNQPCWTGYGTNGIVSLEENTTYYFVVRAFVAVQESDDSNEVKFINGASSPIWIEAEDGNLQWPMEIGDDAAASAGGYVWVPEGTGNFTYPSVNAGYAEFHFEVSEAGDYVIWGRQISNDSTSDSFFVSVDGQAELVWHTKLGGQGVWTWDVVSDRTIGDPRDASNPQQYWLEAGFHSLTIRQREDGTKLDTVVITSDFNQGASYFDSIIQVGAMSCMADINGDGAVNISDFGILSAAFGSSSGDPNWNSLADVNLDGIVNISDFGIMSSEFGQIDCSVP